MTTSVYFNHIESTPEQNLHQDLIIEAIKNYGIDVYYLPRKYLNEDLLDVEFAAICHMIADKENGFVTFFIKERLLHEMIKDVIAQGGDPPKNKLRKVVFKPYSGLDLSGKLKIVGQLIGRSSIDKEMIYDTMLDLNDMGKKITIGRIAGLLDCSARTIHRHMCDTLKQEKQKLNEEL